MRSVASVRPATRPSRDTRASNAPGQSSSVPRSKPMSRVSDKAGEMMRYLRAPRRPAVRNVVPPEVELVADAVLAEQPREPLRRLERARRVLPLPLAADEQKRGARAKPVQVVALQVLHVVERVVEVDRVAALAPPDDGDVVHAAHADRERKEVRALQREVRRVIRTEARAGDDDVAAGVLLDERRDGVGDPALVLAVAPRP